MCVCQTLRRDIATVFKFKVGLLTRYLRVVLEPFPYAICWGQLKRFLKDTVKFLCLRWRAFEWNGSIEIVWVSDWQSIVHFTFYSVLRIEGLTVFWSIIRLFCAILYVVIFDLVLLHYLFVLLSFMRCLISLSFKSCLISLSFHDCLITVALVVFWVRHKYHKSVQLFPATHFVGCAELHSIFYPLGTFTGTQQ